MSDDLRFPRSMGPVDAMFWRLEGERTLRTTTLAVAILDSVPEREALRAALLRTCRRVPRLRQRVVELPAALASPVWQEDPDFDLDYHLRWMARPRGDDFPRVLELAAAMGMQAFDRSRPLWEFVVVEGLTEGRAALVHKLHHSVGDGAAGVALMGELYDFEPTPPRSAPPLGEEAGPEREKSRLALAAEALASALSQGPRVARRVMAEGLAALRTPILSARRSAAELRAVAGIMRSGPGPLSPIMRQRSSRCGYATLRVPNAGLRAAARAHGCTFNDAFLTAVVGGLGRYHQERGAAAGELRAAIPINVRDADSALSVGNRLAIGRFSVPLTERDPIRRMRTIHARVVEQRRPTSLGAFTLVAEMVNRAPPALLLPLVLEEMRKSDFVATTVTGPRTSLHLAGSRVESLFTFGPTAGAALNVTLFRYTDQACVGLTVDPAAIPDRERLVACIQQGFDEVLKLA